MTVESLLGFGIMQQRRGSRQISEHNAYQRSYYETTDKKTMRPSCTPYVFRQLDKMVQVAELRPLQKILEVGCGMGRYTLPLLARGFDLTATDLSPILLERLQSAAAEPNLPLIACDVATIADHTSEMFDRAIGFFTLHHMHDLETIFRGIAKVLKPGALIAFCEPVSYNPLYYIQIAITPKMTWRGDGGIIKMRSSVVLGAMSMAGFNNLRTVKFGFFPPLVTNTCFGARLETTLEKMRIFSFGHAFQIFLGCRR